MLEVDEAVCASESATGHRNRAITWLMRNFDMVDEREDEHLEVYFRQCNPISGEQALAPRYVRLYPHEQPEPHALLAVA